MLTLITCTGFRPEAFKLCVGYMKAQTFKEKLQWIIVNDDLKSAELKPILNSLPAHITPELYQGPETWRPTVNTHKGNVEQALQHVKGDKILFIEDDDYYSPNYLMHMNSWLDIADVVGEANACYYNVKLPGWRRMQNYNQASLCQTGLKASRIGLVNSALRMDGNIDGNLWQLAHKQGVKCLLADDFTLCVGMKCLPGRVGIGVGHKVSGFLPDPNLGILRKWLGAAALPYINFIKQNKSVKREEKSDGEKIKSGNRKEVPVKKQNQIVVKKESKVGNVVLPQSR